MRGWMSLVVLVVVFAFAGCVAATSEVPPSAKVATVPDVKLLAGKWTGMVTITTIHSITSPYTLSIKEDGSWEGIHPNISPGKSKGVMRVSDGKVISRSETTGIVYTVTLHEGEGKRVLVIVSTDGRLRAELTAQ